MIWLSLAALYLVWGSTYFAMRLALVSIPPFTMGAVRFTLAGAILLAIQLARGAAWPTRKEWAASALVGTLLLGLGNGLVGVAEHAGVGSGVAATVVATMPLWAVAFGSVFGQRPTPREVIGLLVGFVGVVVLRSGGAFTAPLVGMLAIIAAPAAWALGSVWSRSLPLPSGMTATAAQMLTGGCVMGLVALVIGERTPEPPRASAVGALLYLIVFGSLLAFSAYGYLLRTVRPALATSYAYVNPLVALLIGAWLGHEPFGATHLFACMWTLAGVALVASAKKKPAPPAQLPSTAESH